MLPLILAVTGGYFIGDSIGSEIPTMSKGGVVTISEIINKGDLKDNIIKVDGKSILIQKKQNPNNYLTIHELNGQFSIDVTVGTIDNPQKIRGLTSTWRNMGDKYYNYDELKSILKNYGLDVN